VYVAKIPTIAIALVVVVVVVVVVVKSIVDAVIETQRESDTFFFIVGSIIGIEIVLELG
jgi:hypothetical protein